MYRRRSFIARHTPFTAYESSTHKPHITISITIIALFIVELVDAAGLLLVAPPRACSAAVSPHRHGYGACLVAICKTTRSFGVYAPIGTIIGGD